MRPFTATHLVCGGALRYVSWVPAETFSDATLLLIAHGSTVNAESAIAPMQHAAALDQMHRFKDVRVCFWKQPPFIRETLKSIRSRRVFAVPLFLSDGYFTSQIIPRELGLPDGVRDSRRAPRFEEQTLFYTAPIGTSPRMTDVILARVDEVLCASLHVPPFPETSLVLAAHGTNKNSDSRRTAEWHIERIRAMNRFADAHAVFMEEQPSVSDTTRITSAENVVVVPFFISDGLHAREDVPVLLGEPDATVQQRLHSGEPTFINPTVRDGKHIWYSASIGTAPLVTEVIMDRVREAAGGGSKSISSER